jgi:hypothetical protein
MESNGCRNVYNQLGDDESVANCTLMVCCRTGSIRYIRENKWYGLLLCRFQGVLASAADCVKVSVFVGVFRVTCCECEVVCQEMPATDAPSSSSSRIKVGAGRHP